MTHFRRQVLIKAFMLFDLAVLALSYLTSAGSIRQLTLHHPFASLAKTQINIMELLFVAGLLISWHFTFCSFGLYQSKRLGNKAVEAMDVLSATGVSAIVLQIGASILRLQIITVTTALVFWCISSSVLILCRMLMRESLRRTRAHGRNLRHVLIVGTNQRALEFAHAITVRPELGYQLIGFADEPWSGSREFEDQGRSIVTDLDHFPEFLRKRVVDEVVIALPIKSFYSKASSIVGHCNEQGVIVRGLTRIFDFEDRDTKLGKLDATRVETYSSGLFEGWPLVCKRLLDVMASATALILLSPILLIIAVLVKLDSPGSIFFVQDRVGLNKRRFNIYKFRTMGKNAEQQQSQLENLNEVDGPVFKIKNDPRITATGRFLRKTSLDELPQLLNVLKGDMSLVGPRPLPIRDFKGFDQDWARRRFSVRPGMTCLWQITGRSSVSFHDWMRLDLHYIDHWSFWLDVKVIAKTIPAVVKGVGAV